MRRISQRIERKLNNWETKFPNQTMEKVLKSQAKTKKELEQAKVQLENQRDYDATKNERDRLQQQAKQKTQQFQLIAKELGLTEQATPEQIKEKLNKLGVPAEDKSTIKNYLTEYKIS